MRDGNLFWLIIIIIGVIIGIPASISRDKKQKKAHEESLRRAERNRLKMEAERKEEQRLKMEYMKYRKKCENNKLFRPNSEPIDFYEWKRFFKK